MFADTFILLTHIAILLTHITILLTHIAILLTHIARSSRTQRQFISFLMPQAPDDEVALRLLRYRKDLKTDESTCEAHTLAHRIVVLQFVTQTCLVSLFVLSIPVEARHV